MGNFHIDSNGNFVGRQNSPNNFVYLVSSDCLKVQVMFLIFLLFMPQCFGEEFEISDAEGILIHFFANHNLDTFALVLRQDRYYADDWEGHSFYGNYDLDFYRNTDFGDNLGLQGSQNINYTHGKAFSLCILNSKLTYCSKMHQTCFQVPHFWLTMSS